MACDLWTLPAVQLPVVRPTDRRAAVNSSAEFHGGSWRLIPAPLNWHVSPLPHAADSAGAIDHKLPVVARRQQAGPNVNRFPSWMLDRRDPERKLHRLRCGIDDLIG